MSTSFIVNLADLNKILEQIKVAERNVAGESLADIIGQDASLLPIGLRTVDGSNNHLLPGQSQAGAADEIFPRLLTPVYSNDMDGDTIMLAPPGTPGFPNGLFATNTNYDPAIAVVPGAVNSHSVVDADPRIISNLIVDQTLTNRSALVAALVLAGATDPAAAADAILMARDAAAANPANQALHGVYVSAGDAAATAGSALSTMLTELTAFRNGIVADNSLDAADEAAVANASAAAHAAKVAQDAVVVALQLNSNVAPATLVAAQLVQTNLTTLDAALSGYAALLGDGLSFSEFSQIIAAQAQATGIATEASALMSTLTAATLDTSTVGANAALISLIEANGLQISPDGSILIEHRSADIGLSPPNSAWMAFFGQFFDHGLDLVTKGGNGTIYIPLQAHDPLIAGADHVFGTADDLPESLRFMTLSRTTPFNADGTPNPNGTESQNTTTPFVDQNQTYTSSASHQAFLREYKFSVDADGDGANESFAVNTGRLLNGVHGGIATWAEIKTQATEKLGLTMNDLDVLDAPQLVVDAYGKITTGAHGYAQVMVTVSETVGGTIFTTLMTVEGKAGGLDLHNITLADLPASFTPRANATAFSVHTVGTTHAFLNDIAHDAAPVTNAAGVLQPDSDLVVNPAGTVLPNDGQGHNTQYDDEMLNSHFVTGDGRGNENIGLTAVHTVFHSEHNRLVEASKDTLVASGDAAIVSEWLAIGSGGTRTNITQASLDAINSIANSADKAAAIDALDWDGERLFQSARFVTEMQYQHLVFEEFARRIQPNVDPFVFTNSADLNPAIVAEFAHTVYRFGHSMLTDTVDRLDNDLSLVNSNNVNADDPAQVTLIQAFLNPQEFSSGGIDDEAATGALVRGMSRQMGSEIDEFVVEALRNNLLGLPLDLPALNIARGREAGIPSLNESRSQIYAMTGAADVKPYTSWTDFAQHIKHPLSVINFIAAYGTHEAVTSVTTLDGKRAAATLLVLGDGDNSDGVTINGLTYTNEERLAFLNGSDLYHGGVTAAGTLGGLNAIDLWIGGLAEELNEFGGQLGSTFNFIFEYQLEHLQNGDRFYYLSRTQGMNLLNLLEPNTFTDLVMRNTDLGDLHSTHLPANLMSAADMILELDTLAGQENYSGHAVSAVDAAANRSLLDATHDDAFLQSIDPKVYRVQGVERVGAFDAVGKQIYDGGILKFSGGEHVVLGGTEGNDTLIGDKGIDALWGDGGNDYLNAGMESDQVFGGDGDDIIEDPFGDDFLRGEAGDDVIVADQGIDLLFGGEGQDFIMGVTDTKEVFAGPGNDFVLGGSAADGLMGNEGDDWIEGGEGFDSLTGENSDLFFNSPIIGHDILDGQGNDTDYDGESGDDIMVQGAGIQRNNGMLGFDWSIQKGDPNDGRIDLGISRFLNQQALTLRDRNDSVEAASGWKHDDTLIGTSSPNGAVGLNTGPIGGPVTDSQLLSQNVDLIRGFEDFIKLTPGGLLGQSAATVALMAQPATHFRDLAPDTTVFDPANGGDILLGGAGSDLITGNAGNDLIDGDRWLNIRIEVHASKDATGPTGAVVFSVDGLTSVVAGSGHADWDGKTLAELMRTGKINPGQLEAVREIITDGASAGDVDVALFQGDRSEFTLVRNTNGTVTVTDTVVAPLFDADGIRIPLLDDEGTDTLSNIEIARFMNRDAAGLLTGGATDVFIGKATGAPSITSNGLSILTASTLGIVEANGLVANTVRYQWQTSLTGVAENSWSNVGALTANPSRTVTDTNFYRVIVSYTDGAGFAETLTSQVTARVGTANADLNFNGTDAANLLNGLAGSDTLNGLGGNDLINGGTGNDAMRGGAGDDIYVVDNAADVVDERVYGGAVATNDSDAGGIDTVQSSLTFALPSATAAGALSRGLVENLTLTGNGNINGTGNALANILIGNSGNNSLSGGDGNDTITGGGGTDSLSGEGGVDTFTYTIGDGADSVDGGTGSDSLVIAGTAAANTLAVAFNGVALTQVSGGNVLNVESVSADLGAGTDTLAYSATSAGVTVNLLAGTASGFTSIANIENVTGTDNIDTIRGNTLANLLLGGGGNDILFGGDGNDRLDGGAGNDTMTGGLNNDTYVVNSALDVVIESALEVGVDTVETAIAAYTLTAGVENLINTGAAAFTGSGNAGNNLLTGGSGIDTLNGLAGNDRIVGGLGNDIIDGGADDDVIVYNAGDGRDRISGGLESALGDTFQVNGSNQAEVYRVYSNRDDWDNIAANGIVSSAVHAGLSGLNAATEIVVTRNVNGLAGAVTNANVIAELSEIEEIVINTGGGADFVLPVGNFNPTNLAFNTITINDDGGTTTVDLMQLTSAHHVVFNTIGTNDTIIGARPQDQVVNGGGNSGGNSGGNGGDDDVAGNGAIALTASDVAALLNLVRGLPGGEDNDATGIRDLSGENNNRAHPEYGAADQPFIRLTDAHFGAFNPVTGNNDINPLFAGLDPRAISNALGSQEAGLPVEPSGANSLFTAFGQYFDHGLDFLGKGGNGTIEIGGPGTGHAPGTDNPADLTRGTVDSIVDGVPQHLNKTSPYVDQNQAYGSNDLVGQFLREGDGHGGVGSHLFAGAPDPSNPEFSLLPTLRELIEQHWANNTVFHSDSLPGGSVAFQTYFAGLVTGGVINEAMLPAMTASFMGSGHALLLDTNPYINLLDHYIAGDGRANENIALTSIHTIWARNHNFHVDGLVEAGFAGTAEELFQAAKIINEAEYQRVVFTEFADELLGGIRGTGDHGFDGYNANVDARISHEFATAAYRFGHSLISQTLTVLDAQGHETAVPLFDAFLNPTNQESAFTLPLSQLAQFGYVPQPGYEQIGVNGILAGGVVQHAEAVDVNIVDAVRNDLVRISADVFAFDVAREWDVGIGSMNQIRADMLASTDPYVREAVGYAGDLTPYASWEDFQSRNGLSNTVIEQFKTAYPDLVLAGADIAAFQAINPGIALGGVNHDTVKGIDRVDLFVGGLAEAHINGGMVGQTFWVVLHEQLDRLQEGDRLYYIDRVENLDLYQVVEEQGFGAIIARNTGLTNLPENVFETSQLDTPPVTGDGDTPPIDDGDDGNDDGDGDSTGNDDDDDDDDTAGNGDDGDDDGASGGTDDDCGDTPSPGTGPGTGTGTTVVPAMVLTGTLQHDVLIGAAGDDSIVGLAGGDVLVGNAGADAISGGDGADFINGGDGRDVIFAGGGDDQVFGGAMADIIYGDAGADRLFGDQGNDLINAGAGNDTVFGGAGDDLIVAEIGDGDDVYFGDDSDGGVGRDTLDMSAATANVFVSLGNGAMAKGSAFSSQTGSDTLWGIEHVNTGSGNDTIVASNVANIMDGGAGNDTFKFLTAAAANGDTILGFEPGDHIDLSAIDANTGTAANDAFTLVAPGMTLVAGQLAVSFESRADGDFTVVEGNTGEASFRIDVAGHQALTAANAIL
jgi:Ca2+-binding RTX toxin-like protein